jgi:hypothetical protein
LCCRLKPAFFISICQTKQPETSVVSLLSKLSGVEDVLDNLLVVWAYFVGTLQEVFLIPTHTLLKSQMLSRPVVIGCRVTMLAIVALVQGDTVKTVVDFNHFCIIDDPYLLTDVPIRYTVVVPVLTQGDMIILLNLRYHGTY